MTATTPLESTTLYDRDYLLWLKTTVEQLKQGQLAEVDLENLIEELEGMARSDRRATKNLLTVLLVHLLKLAYWEAERERNRGHWREEIVNFRKQIQDLLADSPSLKPYIEEIFGDCYASAIDRLEAAMQVRTGSLPVTPIFTLEQTLDRNWLPISPDMNESRF